MKIILDDLTDQEIKTLLLEHLDEMRLNTPLESVHALDLEELRQPDITFWSVWEKSDLIGCGALKTLDEKHAEIKSMRTATAHSRKGVARRLLEHMIAQASHKGYRRLSLETGSQIAFAPARGLYASFGFEYCAPFADYIEDQNSVFMTKML